MEEIEYTNGSRYPKKGIPFALSAFFVFFTVLTWLVRDHAFFWDTIQLGSLQAHWYYDTNFSQFWLPESIDSGHPPALGIYLAGMWTLFGRSLAVSHFALWPFLMLSIWLSYRLGQFFLRGQRGYFVPALLILDPVILAQSVLISPDVVLFCCFLSVLYGICYEIKGPIVLGGLGLGLISMRGMMLLAALFLFQLVYSMCYRQGRVGFRGFIPYLPGAVAGAAFLLLHFLHTGWIGYHAGSPWASSFERTDAPYFLRNVAVLIWRFLDFGRIVLCLMVVLLIGTYFRPSLRKARQKIIDDPKLGMLLLLFATLLLLLTPSLLIHRGLVAHRYLLPVFWGLDLLFLYLLFRSGWSGRLKKGVLLVTGVSLLSGHFWVYPPKISQGWDSSLAHWPYFEIRKEMIRYIDSQGLDYDQIGSAFPNLRRFDHTDLNGRTERFVPYDLKVHPYVFYSNVFNDFTDEAIDELFGQWKVVKRIERRGVLGILFARNGPKDQSSREQK